MICILVEVLTKLCWIYFVMPINSNLLNFE